MKRRITLSPRTNSIIAGRWDMTILTFAYNQDTLNTETEVEGGKKGRRNVGRNVPIFDDF
jgi:hypothetical protein